MISLQDITIENWEALSDSIMKSELAFPESIRFGAGDFTDSLSREGLIAKIARLGNEYIGNVIGYPLSDDELEEYALDGKVRTEGMIYLDNIVIDADYRGNGYGRRALELFIECAREAGYRRLTGHFRPNGSLHLIRSMGAKEISRHKDWSGTGEEYVSCELDI